MGREDEAGGGWREEQGAGGRIGKEDQEGGSGGRIRRRRRRRRKEGVGATKNITFTRGEEKRQGTTRFKNPLPTPPGPGIP